MVEDKSSEDISELVEQAKVVAEATGRDEADVLADLLDDGLVNLSNERNEKDLVTQLKEAADLINTVQSINQEVSENTVLNGGENKTEVNIETTLEGDIVDRAIEAVQRKADNLKKLIITLAPIFLLLTGSGLEAFGIIDIVDDGNGGDSYYDEIWGCTDDEADNYDPDATHDDGSCYWDSEGGSGPPPPYCEYNWIYEDASSMRDDGDINTIIVDQDFIDENSCGRDITGYFLISLFKDDTPYDDEQLNSGAFHHSYSVYHEFNGLEEAGQYYVEVEYFSDEGTDYLSPHQPSFMIEEDLECNAYLSNQQAYLEENDSEQDAIRMSADVWIEDGSGDSCETEQFEVTWRLEQDGDVKYEHKIWEDGEITDSDGGDYMTYLFDGVEIGTYQPRVIIKLNGEILDEKWIGDVTIEEEEEEFCEINLWDIGIDSNATHAWVVYDLDCGYDNNDLGGYNVSVQFLIYNVNETNSGPNATGPLNWTTDLHYIEGWESDPHYMVLSDFVHNNTTHYDFYWYAIWVDGEGNQQLLEEKWLNRELEA